MSGGKESAESANEDQLLAYDPDEHNNAGISGEKHLDTPSVIAAKAPVNDSNNSMSLFKIQQALVKGIIPIARLTDLSMTERKGLDQEGVQQIKQFRLDALSLLTHVNYELNMQRKQHMKPDIGRDYVSLCSPHVPFTDLLFGDDLQKQLKDIGDVNKIGAKVQGHRGPHRSQTGYVNNNNSKGSFSHRNQSKNFKGRTYKPWRHKDSQKSSTNNKRSSQ